MSIRPSGPLKKRRGANLPHWTADHAIYSVTFRLGDSLPQPVIDAYRKERALLLATLEEQRRLGSDASVLFTAGDAQRLQELFTKKIERYLDAGYGACWMNRPEVADLVQNALLHFDQQRYFLHAWCIMPNHVHVLFEPSGFDLPSILHSWKSYTAKEANKLLQRVGEFWQAESFDHLIRDAHDYHHCATYVHENHAKAGLLNWRWVSGEFLTAKLFSDAHA